MRKLLLLAVLALSACGYAGESDVYYFHLVCASQTPGFNDCSDPVFRKRVHDTIEKAWTLFGEDPNKLEGHWRILFKDGPVYDYNGAASADNTDGYTDELTDTITVSTQGWKWSNGNVPYLDVEHSPLAHEMMHYYFHWKGDFLKGAPFHLDSVIVNGAGCNHTDPKWKDCSIWTNMWDFANKNEGVCADYTGQWYYDGSGEGAWNPDTGWCGWCRDSNYVCDPNQPNNGACGH